MTETCYCPTHGMAPVQGADCFMCAQEPKLKLLTQSKALDDLYNGDQPAGLTIDNLRRARDALRANRCPPDWWWQQLGRTIPQRMNEMQNQNTTEWPEEPKSLFPRRRDVRDMAEEVLHALLANYDEDEGEFDRDFLTGVRDLMREGVPFDDAVGSFAPGGGEDVSDLFQILERHDF